MQRITVYPRSPDQEKHKPSPSETAENAQIDNTETGFGGFVTMPLGIFPELFGTNPDNIHITFPEFPGTAQEELPCTDIFHVSSY